MYRKDPGYIRQLKAQKYPHRYAKFGKALSTYEDAHFVSGRDFRLTFGNFVE
jgi:hypothetical protein